MADWWVVSSSNRIMYGGLAQASFANNGNSNGGASGRTVIHDDPISRIRQDGFIRRVIVDVNAVSGSNGWKFKVFRPNGANWDFVGESETVTPAGTGVRTFDLATPIPCQIGDVCGLWLSVTGNGIRLKTGGALRFTTGDITTTNAFASTSAFTLDLEMQGAPPFLAVSGDSIAEGHNVGASWHGVLHTGGGFGISGTPTSEIMNQLRGLIGSTFEYQNGALGSQDYSWVASTGAPFCDGTLATALLMHCGVNDVAAARTWSAVETDLNTIKALIGAGQHLFIDEILPWTAGNDTQADTIRTFNGNLATWCAANSATLISCHDAMGQMRGSTGQLDDLLTAYNQDGVHLTQAGVDAMATIWKNALTAYYAPAGGVVPIFSSDAIYSSLFGGGVIH